MVAGRHFEIMQINHFTVVELWKIFILMYLRFLMTI